MRRDNQLGLKPVQFQTVPPAEREQQQWNGRTERSSAGTWVPSRLLVALGWLLFASLKPHCCQEWRHNEDSSSRGDVVFVGSSVSGRSAPLQLIMENKIMVMRQTWRADREAQAGLGLCLHHPPPPTQLAATSYRGDRATAQRSLFICGTERSRRPRRHAYRPKKYHHLDG